MNPSMINALNGMQGLQLKIDTISNNIANVDTVGFKKRDVSFEDILTSRITQPAGFRLPGRYSPLGLTEGNGAKAALTPLILSQGVAKETSNPLDVMIEGDAFFRVAMPSVDANGKATTVPAYSRDGAFQLSIVNGRAYLTNNRGEFVLDTNGDRIVLPEGATPASLTIDEQGRIFAAGQDGNRTEVGQLSIVRISRPQALEQVGDNLYQFDSKTTNTADLVRAVDFTAQQGDNQIRLRQGFLEGSNVDLSTEMTELLIAQRAYQMNARAITQSDTMMGLANNLRA